MTTKRCSTSSRAWPARAVLDPSQAVQVGERISMRAFNGSKLGFDRARGISEPAKDPERTPTANAILMRFNDGATRPISWEDVVAAALPSNGLQQRRDRVTRAVLLPCLRHASPPEPS